MFNVEKIGMPVAQVKEGPYNGQKIYLDSDLDSDGKDKKGQNMIKIKGGRLQQLPNNKIERNIWMIVGPSGSGKSTYTNDIVKEWKKLNNNNRDIFIFSALRKDKSLDSLKPKRVKIDDTLITDPIEIKEFQNGMVIFDDIDVIKNTKHREEVYKLLNEILETGRHFNISCIMTSHLPTGKDLKRILNETHYVVYFPLHSVGRQIKYMLTEYVDVDKKQIKKIKKQKSRWACIHKNYPKYALTDNSIFTLDDSSSDDEGDEFD